MTVGSVYREDIVMRLLRSAGGLLLLGAVLVVVFSGLNGTGDGVPIKDSGQSFLSALWDGVRGLVRQLAGDRFGGFAGDGVAAFGVSALAVVAAMLAFPSARSGRGFAVVVGAGVALGLALYSPGLLDQLPTS